MSLICNVKENTLFEYCTKVEYNNVTLLKGCCHLLLNIKLYHPSLNLNIFGSWPDEVSQCVSRRSLQVPTNVVMRQHSGDSFNMFTLYQNVFLMLMVH